VRTWSFGDLPRSVERTVRGRVVTAYPALADDGDSAAIIACTSADEQATTMWAGTRRLVRLAMPAPARQVDSLLEHHIKSAMAQSPVQPKVDWYNDIIGCALDHLIGEAGGPVWHAAEFDLLVDAVRDEFHDTLVTVAAAAGRLITLHSAIRRTLDRLVAAPLAPAVGDVREHLDRLVYEGVLTGVGFTKLDDIDRYLRAIERRLATLPNNPQRDAELMDRCRKLEAEYENLAETVSPSGDLEALAWTLEEFRVSSFAQQLRTPVPVSEKRIRNEIHRLARGL
jgi:ATP-dependent helicase HrpA